MVAAPSAAPDLPLKILVAETETGKTLLFLERPRMAAGAPLLPEELAKNPRSLPNSLLPTQPRTETYFARFSAASHNFSTRFCRASGVW